MNKIWTSEEIKVNLINNDKWLHRSILAIHSFQTNYEKTAQTTIDRNNVGFNGCDATILSSFADQLNNRNFLSPKQTVIAKKKMVKYVGQLAKIANREL